MKILVAGLGLIGGSYCKAISSYTSHEVYGYDLILALSRLPRNADV